MTRIQQRQFSLASLGSTIDSDLLDIKTRIDILQDPKGDLTKLAGRERNRASTPQGRQQLLGELCAEYERTQLEPNW